LGNFHFARNFLNHQNQNDEKIFEMKRKIIKLDIILKIFTR